MNNHPKLKGHSAYYQAQLRREPDWVPASIGRRAIAFILDYGILYLVLVQLGVIELLFYLARIQPGQWDQYFYFKMGLQLVVVAYFALTEGGEKAASVGKRLLGLRLLNVHGLPGGYVRAFVRALFLILPTHAITHFHGQTAGVVVGAITVTVFLWADVNLFGTRVMRAEL